MNSTRDALLQSHLDEFVWRVNYVGVNDPLSGILCCIRSKTSLNTYLPSEKYFENAPKFKSSSQNNSVSAASVNQMLCGSGMFHKYLSNYNLEN
jgi:hypothetical protein